MMAGVPGDDAIGEKLAEIDEDEMDMEEVQAPMGAGAAV